MLKEVCSALCLRQHKPEQEDALELVVEGYPQKLLNDRLCCLQKAVDNPGALPNAKVSIKLHLQAILALPVNTIKY